MKYRIAMWATAGFLIASGPLHGFRCGRQLMLQNHFARFIQYAIVASCRSWPHTSKTFYCHQTLAFIQL
jgi:hypothetical protein